MHTPVSPLSALLKESTPEDLSPVCVLESPGSSLKTPVPGLSQTSQNQNGAPVLAFDVSWPSKILSGSLS